MPRPRKLFIGWVIFSFFYQNQFWLRSTALQARNLGELKANIYRIKLLKVKLSRRLQGDLKRNRLHHGGKVSSSKWRRSWRQKVKLLIVFTLTITRPIVWFPDHGVKHGLRGTQSTPTLSRATAGVVFSSVFSSRRRSCSILNLPTVSFQSRLLVPSSSSGEPHKQLGAIIPPP